MTLSDFQARRRHLENVGSTLRVKYPVVGREEVGESLAIVAIANNPETFVPGRYVNDAAYGAATTLDT